MQSESTECGDIVVGGYLGAAPSPRFLEAVRRGERAGAILFKRNGRAPEELFAHTTALVAAAGERPLVVAVDQEGGRVERVGPPVLHLPPALRLAASAPARRDPGFLERVALAQGEQLAAIGFTTSFAPVLDVHSEPANPIIGDRAFGETADAAATGALAFARGLARAGLFACGKHFPGHGATRTDSHLELPRVDRRREDVMAVDVAPFARAATARMPAMMTAHVVYSALDPDRPATLSHAICTDLLRRELGFEGALFSDDLEMKALTAPVEESTIAAVTAGCDLVLVCSDEDAQDRAYAALVRERERSPAFRARLAEAAARSRALRRAHPPAPAADARALAARLAGHDALRAELEGI